MKKYVVAENFSLFTLYFSLFLCTFELRSKVLSLEKTQIYLVFSSLIRTFAADYQGVLPVGG